MKKILRLATTVLLCLGLPVVLIACASFFGDRYEAVSEREQEQQKEVIALQEAAVLAPEDAVIQKALKDAEDALKVSRAEIVRLEALVSEEGEQKSNRWAGVLSLAMAGLNLAGQVAKKGVLPI